MPKNVYEHPPLLEAICEFQFRPSELWDITVPGFFYDKIRESFPLKSSTEVVEVEFQQIVGQSPRVIRKAQPRMRFSSKDERLMTQVGPDLLVVNHLKPYSDWGTFSRAIETSLKAYLQVASPVCIKRLGLRYINRIVIPEKTAVIEEYIKAAPSIPLSIPQEFSNWFQRTEIPYSGNCLLVLQSSPAPDNETGNVTFLLDLDFSSKTDIQLDQAVDWISSAHLNIEKVFEACVTDKSRAIFGLQGIKGKD